MAINNNRVEISLKKEVPHQQWEAIGTFLEGHARLSPKVRRGMWVGHLGIAQHGSFVRLESRGNLVC